MIKKTNVTGVEFFFPELKEENGWYPIIRKPNADYYVLFENEVPMCFVGIVHTGNNKIEVQGLRSGRQCKSPTAIFRLIDWVGFTFMNYHIKIYVINDTVYWAWTRIGFKTIRKKKMRHWTAYWIEREAVKI